MSATHLADRTNCFAICRPFIALTNCFSILQSVFYFYQVMKQAKKILVAPLNWGLGHAARCIPVINELNRLGAEVIIGADGAALELLRKEFPGLNWIHFPGHRVRYHEKGNLTAKLLLQLPQLIMAVITEHRLLKKIIAAEKIDAVIADNRFGLYTGTIASVFITHQTTIKLPTFIARMEPLVNSINHFFISKFDNCWIPDFEGPQNLAGDLSHKYLVPGETAFIGPLSRFTYQEQKIIYDILVLLTGPEPQRTMLERLLTDQLLKVDERVGSAAGLPRRLNVLLVRGITGGSAVPVSLAENFMRVDYLLTKELNSAMLSSGIIISRPGYSTIMDLAVLGSKAILIPTPGQTEQEYLAHYFMQRGIYYSAVQEGFDLATALQCGKNFTGQIIKDTGKLNAHLASWLFTL